MINERYNLEIWNHTEPYCLKQQVHLPFYFVHISHFLCKRLIHSFLFMFFTFIQPSFQHNKQGILFQQIINPKVMKKLTRISFLTAMAMLFLLSACKEDVLSPTENSSVSATAGVTKSGPNYDLDVVLRGAEGANGEIKFRQPNDPEIVIHLDTRICGLTPNTSYLLQRAVDTNLDGNCTSTTWLTLGKGLTPQAIVTDKKGSGKEKLFRDVSAIPLGSTFDIHFQVINEQTQAVVLTSDCYQYTIR